MVKKHLSFFLSIVFLFLSLYVIDYLTNNGKPFTFFDIAVTISSILCSIAGVLIIVIGFFTRRININIAFFVMYFCGLATVIMLFLFKMGMAPLYYITLAINALVVISLSLIYTKSRWFKKYKR